MAKAYKRDRKDTIKPDENWWIRYRGPSGEDKRERTPFRSKRSAEQLLARRVTEVAEGRYLPGRASNITLGEFSKRYVRVLESEGCSPGWLATIQSCLGHLDKRLERGLRTPLRSVSPSVAAEFRASLANDGLKVASVNRYMQILRSMMNRAVALGELPVSPMGSLRLPVERNARTRYLSPQECSRLVEAAEGAPNRRTRAERRFSAFQRASAARRCIDGGETERAVAAELGVSRSTVQTWKKRHRAGGVEALQDKPSTVPWNESLASFVVLALNTGGRCNELLQLRWSDVDFIAKAVTFVETKSRKPRSVPLNKKALAYLERLPRDSVYVFTYNGRPMGRPAKAFKTALQRAGLDGTGVGIHTLRHSWASHQAMGGMPLRTLQQLGGWSSLVMVERYSHLSEQHAAEAVERVQLG